LLGEHTAKALADWLGLDSAAVGGLRQDGLGSLIPRVALMMTNKTKDLMVLNDARGDRSHRPRKPRRLPQPGARAFRPKSLIKGASAKLLRLGAVDRFCMAAAAGW
jgi:hypothetical protein